jgi:hypothetical protein
MSIEAMKQALDVLSVHPEHGGNAFTRAADALRQAIEQAEKQEPSLWFAIGKDGRVKYTTDSDRALKWKQAGSYRLVRDYYTSPVHASDISAERVDETEKRKHACPDWDFLEIDEDCPEFEACLCFDKAVKVEHDPVAWIVDGEIRVRLDMVGKLYYSETNVYTAPPQREWVGLTKAEFEEAIGGLEDLEDCWQAIEAKLKEKNCSAANNS